MKLPCKPGDWLADSSQRVAKVKDVYEGEPGEVLVDLWLYDFDGNRTGRESPPEGGPRTYEPACPFSSWHRIDMPTFPIGLKWRTAEDGRTIADYYAGDTLPNREWVRPVRTLPVFRDATYRKALQTIADGHNDARAVARHALGRKP